MEFPMTGTSSRSPVTTGSLLMLITAAVAAIFVALMITPQPASATVYFHEDFASRDDWVDSVSKPDYGKLVLSSGGYYGDKAINQGLKTTQDARFYAAAAPLPTPVTNKDKDLVVSLSVKHEQDVDCAGGYIKIGPDIGDLKGFNGDSEYFLMFGPDHCGPTNKVQIVLNYKGTPHVWDRRVGAPRNTVTQVYTLRLKPDNTYEFFLDQELKAIGTLDEDWKLLPPKQIPDPNDSKPHDWIDDATMADPADTTKPDDWDEDAPLEIPDPNAVKPASWRTDLLGEWRPSMIPNPEYKGKWSPRRVANPNYKGVWVPRQIPNPDYKEDKELYLARKPLQYVGIDIWQVKSGTIFDNIILADNLDEVNDIIDKTWGATIEEEAAEAKVYLAEQQRAEVEAQERAAEEIAAAERHWQTQKTGGSGGEEAGADYDEEDEDEEHDDDDQGIPVVHAEVAEGMYEEGDARDEEGDYDIVDAEGEQYIEAENGEVHIEEGDEGEEEGYLGGEPEAEQEL